MNSMTDRYNLAQPDTMGGQSTYLMLFCGFGGKPMKLQDNYDVGIYCRLSRDDNNGSLESMSIANQRQMLTDYVREKGWCLKECYVDDGWTGTNFDRPDFQRMIRDAEAGRIDCIITKDLSRLGRNYVQAGYYTEEFFVEHDIRFIAVNDSIDTMQENNDIAAFHHVLNEFYPKQVSKKIRQVIHTGAQQGKFMNSLAPYGYMKSPEDRHILIVDDEAARIVRRLFEEFVAGDSARRIAENLNMEGIDSPRYYHYAKMGRQNPFSGQRNVWGSTSVSQMLRNQVYIGNMVQGKREVVSFKTKKRRQVDPDGWIVVENTHEPIISRELWDRAHKRLSGKRHTRTTKRNTVGLFAGILRCADCGSPLAYMRKKLKGSEKGVYRCSRYNNNGGKACTPHYIDESDICAYVINDIRLYAYMATEEREMLAKRLMASSKQANSGETNTIRSKIREAESRLTVIAATLKSLYEDKSAGKLPEAVFFELMDGFVREQAEIEERLPCLRHRFEELRETTGEIENWLSLIGSYMELEALNRDVVSGLIESIAVSERVKQDGRQTQELEIQYRFIGNLLLNTQDAVVSAI
jgi:DNA invertase Pin-like site-specific DNA recombinase